MKKQPKTILEADIEIICKDCGEIRIFNSREQEFFDVHDYPYPKRCKSCIAKKHQRFNEPNHIDC